MKVSSKIILLILSVIIVTLGVINIFTSNKIKSELEGFQSHWVNLLSQTISAGIAQDTIDANSLRVTETLKLIADNDKAIEYAYVTDFEGRLFAHTFVGGVPRFLAEQAHEHDIPLDQRGVRKVYQTTKGKIIEYEAPILENMVAHLHIGIINTEVNQVISHTVSSVLYFSVAIGIVASIIAWLFGKQITRPLVNLSYQVRRYGEGAPFDIKSIKQGGAEIEQLKDNFTEMVAMRSEIEGRLREREENLSLTLDSIGDGVIVTDNEGVVTRLNPVAQSLTGWSMVDAVGKPLSKVFKIVDSFKNTDAPNPVDKVLESGEVVELANHTILISKSKKEYHVADSAAPIKSQSGDILGVILVFRDVTREYSLRRRIYNNENRLKMALQGTKAGLIDWNLQDDAVYYSPRWYEIFSLNREREEAGISQWEALIHPVDVAKVKGLMQSLLEGKSDIYKSEHRVLNSHGDTLWVAEQGTVTENDASGKPVRFVGTILDVTELHRHEEELRRGQKMDALGKLTGGVAHDFNNILGVILGYAEIIKMEYTSDKELLESIDEIKKAGLRGQKLTKNLLSFSRKKETEAEQCNLNTLLKDMEGMLAKSITVRIELKMSLDPALWDVRIDDGDFKNVLLNLALNSAYAVSGNGQISLDTSNVSLSKTDAYTMNLPEGDYVRFSISDTGSGMDEETLSKVFDPFFTTKGNDGTGLGLSQVYGFVQRSMGGIKVYSEPGHGTRFTLLFPRLVGVSQKVSVEQAPVAGGKDGHETILVVDDEEGMRKVASEILHRHGYHAIVAEDGESALFELSKNNSIDLVISDVIMPSMNGYQLANEIRDKYPGIGILLASGFSDNRGAGENLSDLDANMLHKPYSTDELLGKIRNILDEELS